MANMTAFWSHFGRCFVFVWDVFSVETKVGVRAQPPTLGSTLGGFFSFSRGLHLNPLELRGPDAIPLFCDVFELCVRVSTSK